MLTEVCMRSHFARQFDLISVSAVHHISAGIHQTAPDFTSAIKHFFVWAKFPQAPFVFVINELIFDTLLNFRDV